MMTYSKVAPRDGEGSSLIVSTVSRAAVWGRTLANKRVTFPRSHYPCLEHSRSGHIGQTDWGMPAGTTAARLHAEGRGTWLLWGLGLSDRLMPTHAVNCESGKAAGALQDAFSSRSHNPLSLKRCPFPKRPNILWNIKVWWQILYVWVYFLQWDDHSSCVVIIQSWQTWSGDKNSPLSVPIGTCLKTLSHNNHLSNPL